MPVDQLHVPPSDDPTRETYLSPGEIITSIILPPVRDTTYSRYRKVRTRQAWDFALAGLALVLNMDGPKVDSTRVYLSGCAPVPWRSAEIEESITGKILQDDTIAQAADKAVSQAKPLGQNAYKLDLVRGILQEELSLLQR
jgi:xanthine dehydrogenase YagS FAD-binding subunit